MMVIASVDDSAEGSQSGIKGSGTHLERGKVQSIEVDEIVGKEGGWRASSIVIAVLSAAAWSFTHAST